MTTFAELEEKLDRLNVSIEKRMTQYRALLNAARYVWEELDQHYDVDEESGTGKKTEYPFSGAGECMRRLKAAIERCEHE